MVAPPTPARPAACPDGDELEPDARRAAAMTASIQDLNRQVEAYVGDGTLNTSTAISTAR